MRKIMSEAEMQRKKKKSSFIMGIFMLLVLVFGVAGFGFLFNPTSGSNTNSDDSTQIEEGTLINVGDRWAANIQGQAFYFSNSLESVKDIPVEITNTLNIYAGSILYISSENNAITSEIASTLGRYSSRVQEACYGPCEEDLPEKSCSENLIVWRDSPENKVYQEDNCIFIEGDLIAVDAFLYNLFQLN